MPRSREPKRAPGELADLWAMAQMIGAAIGLLLAGVHWLLT